MEWATQDDVGEVKDGAGHGAGTGLTSMTSAVGDVLSVGEYIMPKLNLPVIFINAKIGEIQFLR